MALPLLDLGIVALLFLVIGLALAISLIMRELANVLAGIQVVGGFLARAVNAMAQQITNAAGKLEAGVDKLIGASWHSLARFTDHLWDQITGQSGVLAQFGHLLGHALYNGLGIRSITNHLARLVHVAAAGVKTLEREFHGIEHRVRTLAHDLAHGIGHDVLPRIRSLDRELNHIRHRVIPSIRSDVATAEGEITHLYDWAKGKASLLGVGTFAFAIAAVIGQEAFQLLRCTGVPSIWRKWGCGLWGLVDGLLGLVISALALENVCTLLPVLESAFGDVVGPIIHLLTEVPLGGCETPPKGWAVLNVAAGPLPPQQILGPLPG